MIVVAISRLGNVSLRVKTRGAARSRLRRALAGAVIVVTALAFSSAASAASPCANQVIDDWSDNSRIDRIYDLPCYEEAIDAFPAELRDYTNFEQVVTRALQSAAHASGITRAIDPKRPRSIEPPRGPAITPGVRASSTTAVPLPVIVLASLFVVLLGAGGLSHLARRRRRNP